MLKLAILAILAVPSILAASISKQLANTLIAENDTDKLEQTFQTLHKKHGDDYSSEALVEAAERGHPEIVSTCLRAERDSFPNDEMRVSGFVSSTVLEISTRACNDPESFAKAIASFKPTDVKPLASIRNAILTKRDPMDVLERVMDKSPKLIIDSLPNWLANHEFDRNSQYYITAREGAFQYLASFATESVLEKSLPIVKKNEHYRADMGYGFKLSCCNSQDYIPQDLIDKLTGLLALMKARNELIKGVLQSLLPEVIIDLMLDYAPN